MLELGVLFIFSPVYLQGEREGVVSSKRAAIKHGGTVEAFMTAGGGCIVVFRFQCVLSSTQKTVGHYHFFVYCKVFLASKRKVIVFDYHEYQLRPNRNHDGKHRDGASGEMRPSRL